MMFTVEATGTDLAWRWERAMIQGGEDWQPLTNETGKVEGANTATLTITGLEESDEGDYRCVVSNLARDDTSPAVHLTVARRWCRFL